MSNIPMARQIHECGFCYSISLVDNSCAARCRSLHPACAFVAGNLPTFPLTTTGWKSQITPVLSCIIQIDFQSIKWCLSSIIVSIIFGWYFSVFFFFIGLDLGLESPMTEIQLTGTRIIPRTVTGFHKHGFHKSPIPGLAHFSQWVN